MLKLAVTMHRRNPGHEIKAVLNFTDRLSHKEMRENVKELLKRLQETIPASFRAKYLENPEGIVLTVRTSKLNEAHGMQSKIASCIKSAASAMHIKTLG